MNARPPRPADPFDAALADTFPAGDPSARTTSLVATPAVNEDSAPYPGPRQVNRVVPRKQVEQAFVDGARAGRWTSEGTPAAYASLRAAGAILEFPAHLEGDSPQDLVLVTPQLPGDCVAQADRLPPRWRERPYREDVRAYGNCWVQSGRALALELPGVLCEQSHNVLINPRHADAPRLRIRPSTPSTSIRG